MLEVFTSLQLPSGLYFDTFNMSLEYDGSKLQAGSFDIFVIDSFGNQTLKINYSSMEIIKHEGRVLSDFLLNSSANEILSNPQVNSIESGQHHVCITESDGGMKCWGRDNTAALDTAVLQINIFLLIIKRIMEAI